MTILTLISFSLAMVIAVAVALVQYANVPVRQMARFYIQYQGLLLVQLFIILTCPLQPGINAGCFSGSRHRLAFNARVPAPKRPCAARGKRPRGQLVVPAW